MKIGGTCHKAYGSGYIPKIWPTNMVPTYLHLGILEFPWNSWEMYSPFRPCAHHGFSSLDCRSKRMAMASFSWEFSTAEPSEISIAGPETDGLGSVPNVLL